MYSDGIISCHNTNGTEAVWDRIAANSHRTMQKSLMLVRDGHFETFKQVYGVHTNLVTPHFRIQDDLPRYQSSFLSCISMLNVL